ncbi:hypothetical protein CYMTET_34550, partial [Cymbomonas tetramitiformis]
MSRRGIAAALHAGKLHRPSDIPEEAENPQVYQQNVEGTDVNGARFTSGARNVRHAVGAIHRMKHAKTKRSMVGRQISWFLERWYPEDGGLVDESQKKIMQKAVHERVIIQETAVRQLAERQGIKDVLISGTLFTIMMTLYFTVILLQRRIEDAFALEYSIKEYVRGIKYLDQTGSANTLRSIHDHDALWTWMEDGYVPALNPVQEWYNGDVYSETETGFFLEYNRLIGGVKMIQQRVDPCACENFDETELEKCGYCPANYNEFYPTVWPKYSKSTTSEAPFGPSYDPEKYVFHAEELNGKGGFVCVLPPDRKKALLTLQELK